MRGKFLLWAALALVLAAGCATSQTQSANDGGKDAAACPECGESGNPGRSVSPAEAASTEAVQGLGYAGPMPLRSSAKIMRVWLAPWESMDGALNLPTYLYAEVVERKWSIGERRMEVAPSITPLLDRTVSESPGKFQKKPAGKAAGKAQKQADLGTPKENPHPAPTLDTTLNPKNASKNPLFNRKTGRVLNNNSSED